MHPKPLRQRDAEDGKTLKEAAVPKPAAQLATIMPVPRATEKHAGGRETLLTPEVAQRIVSYVRAGAFDWVAAEANAVSRKTFWEWLARGEGQDPDRPPTPQYAEFAEQVRTARAEARLSAEIEVKRGEPLNWLMRGPGRDRPGEPGPPPGIPQDEFDDEARALWMDTYPTQTKGAPGFVGAITRRREALVRRIAAIYALADGERVVQAPHLRAALAVWTFSAESADMLFGRHLGHPVAEDVLSILRLEEKLTRTDLSGKLGRNVRSKDIDEGIVVLRRLEAVDVYEERTGHAGRPRQWVEITEAGRRFNSY